MTTFDESADLRGATFERADLTGARFVGVDLTGVVMRGVDLAGADLDSPWLLEDGGSLLVNGVDVAPLVEAELNRRFPGRGGRRAADSEGLRAAWAAAQAAWSQALARVEAMPPGAVDESVDGEWSFAETLRHLVMATDTWLGRGIHELEQPYHPIGMPNAEYALDGYDPSVFSAEQPSYDEVLTVRAERVAMVGDYLAAVTPEVLDEPRWNPWAPAHPETVRSCLHVILNEEWQHLQYALRDLDAVAARTPESHEG